MRTRIVALLVLAIVATSIPLFAATGNVLAWSDTGARNRVWFSVAQSNYEVALQVVDPQLGYRTLFTRDNNTPRNNHPFDFYDLGNNQFRVLLSKVNGVYVNKQCGTVIDWRWLSGQVQTRSCPSL